MMTIYRVALLCLIGQISFYHTCLGNVIGIDFGSDAVKVGIVSPGTPLDIVTNFQSKRKTPMVISFNKGERAFGSDAYALMGRKPETTVSKLYRMIGRSMEQPVMKELAKQYFPYKLSINETTQAVSLQLEDTQYTPEELLSMMMNHIMDMTKAFKGKIISDCVITVPSYFTQHEKSAVLAAASIADLNVLSLMDKTPQLHLTTAWTETTINRTTQCSSSIWDLTASK